MNSSRNKKEALLFAAILVMSSIAALAMQAQAGVGTLGTSPTNTPGYPNLGPLPAGVTPAYTFTSEAYLSFRPNPIGVGQSLLVNMWTTPGSRHSFYMQGYKVTIQHPDGSTEVVGPFNSYIADNTAWFEYVPDTPGTYKLKFESAGTYIPAGTYWDQPGLETGGFGATSKYYTLYTSVYYTPSSTDWQELTVQPDMIASWPPSPLPTDYWTRPVSPENREWYVIAGNFPWTGAYYYPNGRVLYGQTRYKYTAYVQAPNTAHVLWRRQGNLGGIIGGDAYIYSLSGGGGTPTIIFNGRCYQTLTKQVPTYVNGSLMLWPSTVWECYDLRTGQVYWDIQGVAAPTNIYYEKSTAESVPGAEASQGYTANLVAISGSRLYKYNPWTGAASLNITLPSYITSGQIYNNERVLSVQSLGGGNYRLINWSMAGSSTNFTTRIGTNITWPRSSVGNVDLDAGVAVSVSRSTSGSSEMEMQWCVGVNMSGADLYTGARLWDYNSNDTLETVQMGGGGLADRGKVAYASHNRVWVCFDARTGKKLWTSEKAGYPWGEFWAYNMASYDFNESKSAIIGTAYDGVYAFDWDNGKILWHYSVPSVPFEDPYGQAAFFTGVQIADGKIYAYSGEHTPSQPVTRGWKLHCINATTGEGIWSITGPMAPGAIADGYLTASNTYDGYMYVFGKGQSATTVTAPLTAVPLGTAMTIQGTVMDISPGDLGSTTNPAARLDAKKSVPCVSKDSMSTEMEYLYMQHPINGIWHNLTITGVPVTLTAIGSNGTVIDIGSTTTNGYYGTFGYAWTPTKEDTYTIMASFTGDDSYGTSTAATMVTVGPAPAPYPTVEIPTPADYTMTIVGAAVAIIIALVVATLLILRKR
jgi:outer membrane protein assembly factor BamB